MLCQKHPDGEIEHSFTDHLTQLLQPIINNLTTTSQSSSATISIIPSINLHHDNSSTVFPLFTYSAHNNNDNSSSSSSSLRKQVKVRTNASEKSIHPYHSTQYLTINNLTEYLSSYNNNNNLREHCYTLLHQHGAVDYIHSPLLLPYISGRGSRQEGARLSTPVALDQISFDNTLLTNHTLRTAFPWLEVHCCQASARFYRQLPMSQLSLMPTEDVKHYHAVGTASSPTQALTANEGDGDTEQANQPWLAHRTLLHNLCLSLTSSHTSPQISDLSSTYLSHIDLVPNATTDRKATQLNEAVAYNAASGSGGETRTQRSKKRLKVNHRGIEKSRTDRLNANIFGDDSGTDVDDDADGGEADDMSSGGASGSRKRSVKVEGESSQAKTKGTRATRKANSPHKPTASKHDDDDMSAETPAHDDDSCNDCVDDVSHSKAKKRTKGASFKSSTSSSSKRKSKPTDDSDSDTFYVADDGYESDYNNDNNTIKTRNTITSTTTHATANTTTLNRTELITRNIDDKSPFLTHPYSEPYCRDEDLLARATRKRAR